jgi:tRNA pseudouridine55 synthase
LLEHCIPKIIIEVSCSKGTYIRTLAEDIGLKLGCGAHVANLKRVAVGSFTIEETVKLEDVSIDFAKMKADEFKKKYLKPVDVFLNELSSVYLSNEESRIIVNGGNVSLPFEFDTKFKEQEVKIYNVNVGFIGLGMTNARRLVPKRLINLDKSVLG